MFDKILDKVHLRSQRPVASASGFAAVGLLRLALALPRVPVPQVAPAVLALDGYKNGTKQNSSEWFVSEN